MATRTLLSALEHYATLHHELNVLQYGRDGAGETTRGEDDQRRDHRATKQVASHEQLTLGESGDRAQKKTPVGADRQPSYDPEETPLKDHVPNGE
jgi:hypothetical protein